MMLERLRSIRESGPLSVDDVFEALFEAGAVLNESDRASDQALEIVIRLLDAERAGLLPEGCSEAVQLFAEECGLYPYVEVSDGAIIDRIVREAHRVKLKNDVVLHAKQMEVLLTLLSGQNVILSGPTSFGKSLILDAYIARMNPISVAAILPTLALIDETRRRIGKHFPHFQVITTVAEEYDPERPVFFALTQERFLQRRDISNLDMLFVDEFYKLDKDRDDSRFEVLNLALYRGIPKAKQVFMAGPHVQDISLGKRWRGRFTFIATDYRTVAVNLIDRSETTDRDQAFIADLRLVGDESSIVFSASPPSAEKVSALIRGSGISFESDQTRNVAAWLRENYHSDWRVADAVEHGIGLHHGRIPRSIGQLFVKLFDAGIIKVLICTSTLIEGVNTSAANIFVYDKKINKTDFDFFSFANIRGRVGRMMRHFVGNAFLYHEPPDESQTEVDIPILSDEVPSSDYLLLNMEDMDLDRDGLDAKQASMDKSSLPLELLREHSNLGLELLEELNRLIIQALEDGSQLVWSGMPDLEESRAIAEVALFIAHRRRQPTGIHTKKQVAWAWGQMIRLKTLREFVTWFSMTFGDTSREGIDGAFQFLQATEFAFPRAIAVAESIVNLHAGPGSANYSLFVHGLENWFRPPWIKTLDEMGVPIPLSERYSESIEQQATKLDALAALADLHNQSKLEGLDSQLYELAFAHDELPLLDVRANAG